jgi:hypothetical protein
MTEIVRYLKHRRDTSANWTSNNPTPKAGQICFTTDVLYTGTDQMKFKVGDGTQTWAQLDYMPIGTASTPTLQQVLTSGSVLTGNNTITGAFDFNLGTDPSKLDSLSSYSISFTELYSGSGGSQSYLYLEPGVANIGSGSGGININGSAITITGTFQGISTTQLGYLTTLSSNVQTQLNACELLANKGAAGGYAPLDGSGKIANSYLPSIALTDVFTVASQAAQLALIAEEGDVAVRTDLNKSYVHNGGSSGTMSDWQELLTPTDAVLSVNGGTGAVTIAVTGTSNRITVTGGSGLTPTIDISSSYVGQNTITTLGTIGTGTWQGSSISTTYTDAKIKGAATTNGVLYASATDTAATSTSLTWDNSTSRLKVGTGTLIATASDIGVAQAASVAISLTSTGTTTNSVFYLGKDGNNYGHLIRYNNAFVGNYTNSSIALADLFKIAPTVGGTMSAGSMMVAGGTIYNVTGTTSTNAGTRLSTKGLHIASLANLHSDNVGGGDLILYIQNATTVPTSNPTNGGIIYVEAGDLKYRGSSGTITTLGIA